MPTGVAAVLRWFDQMVAPKYAAAYLRNWDLSALQNDATYGIKLFLQYAAQRAGASHAFEVAGIKAVSACVRDAKPLTHIPGYFTQFCHGKLNLPRNPAMDPKLAQLDVPAILANLQQGDLKSAFNNINVRGAGHKTRSFFLGDLVAVAGAATQNWNTKDHYLFCHPIDHWVCLTAQCLRLSPSPLLNSLRRNTYGLGGNEFRLAVNLIEACRDAGVSPIAVNQGIWYFARNAVADDARLQLLLQALDPQTLRQELDLLGDFFSP